MVVFILGSENLDRYDFKALLKLSKSFVCIITVGYYGNQDGVISHYTD